MICVGKTRFETHEQAQQALAAAHQEGPRSDKIPIRVYACGICHGHHLTARPEFTKADRVKYARERGRSR
jgi:hypothetical protein